MVNGGDRISATAASAWRALSPAPRYSSGERPTARARRHARAWRTERACNPPPHSIGPRERS